MERIIQFILHGCWHDWHPVNVQPIDHYDVSFGPRGFMYRTLPTQCAKCGRINHIKDYSGTLTYADIANPPASEGADHG